VITREQVAELQPGDIIEVFDTRNGVSVRGKVYNYSGPIWIGNPGHTQLTVASGELVGWAREDVASLKVITRAPRKVYVNSDRTEVRQHDVIRDGEGVIRHQGPVSDVTDAAWWSWEVDPGFRWTWTSTPPQPLTLLVDGETGEVVK
jgi:hypothetical protein